MRRALPVFLRAGLMKKTAPHPPELTGRGAARRVTRPIGPPRPSGRWSDQNVTVAMFEQYEVPGWQTR